MEVEFFWVETTGNVDERRTITDFVLPESMIIPFKPRQIKRVRPSEEGVKQGMVLGNHYHGKILERWELFVVIGPAGKDLFTLYHRDCRGGEIQEYQMMAGDGCIIPPGISHAFIALESQAELWVISNLPYSPNQSVSDKLV